MVWVLPDNANILIYELFMLGMILSFILGMLVTFYLNDKGVL